MELILPKCWIKFSGFLLTHEILLIDEREISTLDYQDRDHPRPILSDIARQTEGRGRMEGGRPGGSNSSSVNKAEPSEVSLVQCGIKADI